MTLTQLQLHTRLRRHLLRVVNVDTDYTRTGKFREII